jgi:hypothetical protein
MDFGLGRKVKVGEGEKSLNSRDRRRQGFLLR